MRLVRKPGHLSIFPTSKQSGLGPIPGFQIQFPLGIKSSTNYIALGRKLSSKGPNLHFPCEWDALEHWVAPQPRVVWDSHPSFSPSAHCSPSLPCSLAGPLLGGSRLCFCLLQSKTCHPNLGKRNTLLIDSAHGLLWLYLPAHCAWHLLEHKLFGGGIDSSQTRVTKTALPWSTRKSMSVPKEKAA